MNFYVLLISKIYLHKQKRKERNREGYILSYFTSLLSNNSENSHSYHIVKKIFFMVCNKTKTPKQKIKNWKSF